MSELLARRAKKVIAVDNSEKMVTFGANKAKKNGLKNLEFRLGDLENPPIEPQSVDLVILSQALHHAAEPARAVVSAHRILRHGGQLMVLDLLKHNFDRAHEALWRPLARLRRKRFAALARNGGLQEGGNHRGRARRTAAALPDHPGER